MQSACQTTDEEVHAISRTVKLEVPGAPRVSHGFLSCRQAPSLLAPPGRNASHQDLQKICPYPVASAKQGSDFRKEQVRVPAQQALRTQQFRAQAGRHPGAV